MLAQFQTQLRFSDEIIQAATETGCLRKAFFLALSPRKKRLSFYWKRKHFQQIKNEKFICIELKSSKSGYLNFKNYRM